MLDIFPTLGIAFGLAMDAFSVAIATGIILGIVMPRQAFRLSFHFGLFQFLMPIIGWLAGSTLAPFIASYDHWLALALLSYVGGKMIWESAATREQRRSADPTRGASLVVLSVATSVDALAVGLSMALLGIPVLYPAIVIGVVAAAMTLVGMRIGRYAGSWLGPWMERAGGLILILIGLKIVFEQGLR